TYTPTNGQVWFDEVRTLPDGYASELPNGGFELADVVDSTLPRYWTRGSTATSVYAALITTDPYERASYLKLNNNSHSPQMYYDWSGYAPSKAYTLSFWAMTGIPSANVGSVQIWDVSTTPVSSIASVEVNNSTASVWTKYTKVFTAPSSQTDTVQIQLSTTDG